MPAATYSPTPFPMQWLCLLLVASLLAGGSRRWAKHGLTNPQSPITKRKGPTRFHVGPFVEIMPAATYSPTPFPMQWLCLLLVASLLAGGSRRWAKHGLTNPQSLIPNHQKKRPDAFPRRAFCRNNAGSDLLSHTVSHAVPSAVSGLTSVFGMGTGVTLIL
jgi:hypothetical protein